MSDLREITQEHLEAVRWRARANKAAEVAEGYLSQRLFPNETENMFGGSPHGDEIKEEICKELARLWTRAYFSCDRVAVNYEIGSGEKKRLVDQLNELGVEGEGEYSDIMERRVTIADRASEPAQEEEAKLAELLEHAEGSLRDAQTMEQRLFEVDEKGELKHWQDVLEQIGETIRTEFDRRKETEKGRERRV